MWSYTYIPWFARNFQAVISSSFLELCKAIIWPSYVKLVLSKIRSKKKYIRCVSCSGLNKKDVKEIPIIFNLNVNNENNFNSSKNTNNNNLKKWYKWTYFKNRNKTHRHRKQIYQYQRGEWRRNKLGIWD